MAPDPIRPTRPAQDRSDHAQDQVAVALAKGHRRPDDRPRPRVLPDQLLGLDLGPGIELAKPEILTQRFVFGEEVGPFPRMAVDRDRADVQDAADRGIAAGVQHGPRGVDDVALECAPRAPVADARGTVIHHVRSFDRSPHRRRVLQIALGQLDAQGLEKRHIARRPHQRSHPFAALHQPLGDVTTQQPGRPGHDIHPVRHVGSPGLGALLPSASAGGFFAGLERGLQCKPLSPLAHPS